MGTNILVTDWGAKRRRVQPGKRGRQKETWRARQEGEMDRMDPREERAEGEGGGG